MYTIFFINFGYAAPQRPNNIKEAIEVARRAGFESGIWRDGKLVASYSPINGLTYKNN